MCNCNCNKTICDKQCSCKEYCKTTFLAQCVRNLKELLFLKASGQTNTQTLLISINNALKSISESPCVSYTRTIDPETNIASYVHTLNTECLAAHICPICNTPCECDPPTGLIAEFVGAGVGSGTMFRAMLNWTGSDDATTYRVEYKRSVDSEWSLASPSVSGTSYDGIILDIEDPSFGYDFRVRANCEGCSSAFISTTVNAEECDAPSNASYDKDTLALTWNADPGLTMTDFNLGYRLSGVSTFTPFMAPITETSPGVYSANLAGMIFSTNRIYNFSIVRNCNGVLSDRANGCASICTVPVQSSPSISLSSSSDATVSWSAVSGVHGYKIRVFNVTDSTVFIPTTLLGATTIYTLSGLDAGKTYRVTITPVCSLTTDDCEGRDAIFVTPSPPEFTIYRAAVYSCQESGCVLDDDNVLVRVPYPTTLNIGSFYRDTIPTPAIYEILAVSTGTTSIQIDTLTEELNCGVICPPTAKWYMSNVYVCTAGVCSFVRTEKVKVPVAYTLVIGGFYKDVSASEYIYEITSLTTPGTAVILNHTTHESTCVAHCPIYNYNVTRRTCSQQCSNPTDTTVTSLVPLSIGMFYLDASDADVTYEILSTTLTTGVNAVDPTPYGSCSIACV